MLEQGFQRRRKHVTEKGQGPGPAIMDIKRLLRGPLPWIALVVVVVVVVLSLLSGASGYTAKTTSEVLTAIQDNNVKSATIVRGNENTIQIELKNGDEWEAAYVSDAQATNIADELQTAATKGNLTDGWNTKIAKSSFWGSLLISVLPLVLIVVLFLFLMNQAQGGGGRVMNFGKSKAKLISKDNPEDDVQRRGRGQRAIEELQEIKEFLQEPAKFQSVGAKIPKGVLLYGPPGTGKTLLARAVAGEAGVPFYSISGSDFVEMFVGVGASRVRDLFEQAKANAPAIVFVDEIDAVGRQRGAGLGGGHDEREQTLNQLLVEMDGFDTRGGSSSSPRRTAPTSSTRRCCARAASTGRSPSSPPTSRAATRSSRCTRAASRSPATSTSPRWHAGPRASPAPTWPTCSTRRRCSRPAGTRS